MGAIGYLKEENASPASCLPCTGWGAAVGGRPLLTGKTEEDKVTGGLLRQLLHSEGLEAWELGDGQHSRARGEQSGPGTGGEMAKNSGFSAGSDRGFEEKGGIKDGSSVGGLSPGRWRERLLSRGLLEPLRSRCGVWRGCWRRLGPKTRICPRAG